ncbi:MAG: PLP-dependent aminotransferase family protein, partial [Bdellovibrionales bacterium]|nr:PLP-dependent aminotransferase family protein [Bdellovibrionales bacterium]
MDYCRYLAERTASMDPSAIRELFKVLGTPGMISLAGGAPAPDCLPLNELKTLHQELVEEYGYSLLQYGITEGFLPLREQLALHLRDRGINVPANSIFVSTGAQTAIDAAGKILINKGDAIALESPTFLASIKTFRAYQPQCFGIPMDAQGIIPDALETILKEQKPKFIYVIPNFQNPSGRTLSMERRLALVQLAKRYETLVIEDDPYYELRYSGEPLPTLYSLLPDQVIYIGSLSKIFAPGMRVGYFLGPEPLTTLMTSSRQAVDVHTNTYAQALATKYFTTGAFAQALPRMLELYRGRRDILLASM